VTPLDGFEVKRSITIRAPSRRSIYIQDRAPRWLRKFYIQMNSQARFLIDFVSFLNLFYIAISTSLQVGFDVKMSASLVGAEVVSLLFSIFVVISSLRTPVMVKGEATLKFKQVVKYQWHNGLFLDLIACLPFNLAFGLLHYYSPIYAFARCIRIVAAWKCLALFGQFQIYLKRHSMFLSGFKAFCLVFFLCHFVSCIWNYVQSQIQDDIPHQQLVRLLEDPREVPRSQVRLYQLLCPQHRLHCRLRRLLSFERRRAHVYRLYGQRW